ncbi:MAG: bifunctional phosphopantothenoylcysteine decarboxylase/phosphopantothenate--cysteine ligase CoaBC [Candidatus Cloacimonas sp.]|jgi:phosphopantothenoylcysteine decarboxylase/phosphopantothenate--cysteine ligase|nr:bifunctional phosphopantothenoylcysteine decarboxylase/phosphopantothenate--cysteine ligase CoaBC [Candidatus Cloacimonas sp.]
MQAKNILLCVCGGIAAYKAIDLASMLHKNGYVVKTVLTDNAQEFVTPLNFEAITHNSAHTDLYSDNDPIPHISLADWADLVVVCPATANIIAKAAHGLGDDLLSTVLLAHTKPILFVPAMNVNMYRSVAVQDNLNILQKRGHYIMQPESGMLACGYEGKGKYPANGEIVAAIATYLRYKQDLVGKKVLLTAGATVEAIDPMRFISNRSSGKMGLAFARALALRGAEVYLLYANIGLPIPHYLQETVHCLTAKSMYDAVMERFEAMDWIIKCAAVADYQLADPSMEKLPKQAGLCLNLIPTPDILEELGHKKAPGQKLIGFAAQTENIRAKAFEKFKRKQVDLMVANNINVAGKDDSEITVIGALPISPEMLSEPQVQFVKLIGDKLTLAHGIIDIINTL